MIICRRSLFLEAKAYVCVLNRGRQSVKELTLYKKTHVRKKKERKKEAFAFGGNAAAKDLKSFYSELPLNPLVSPVV